MSDQDWSNWDNDVDCNNFNADAKIGFHKITNDDESLFVYEKINEKLDIMCEHAHDIYKYDVDNNIKNKLNMLVASIETIRLDAEYLNTRTTTKQPNDGKLSDIEREWAFRNS